MAKSVVRDFQSIEATLEEVPLLIGLEGPPGGGKTFSALRLGEGMQRVRRGPVVLVDTEGGRSRKYAKQFAFRIVEMGQPFRPTDFLAAVEAQLPLNPSCIIIDSMSDEHEGPGGVLDWQEQELQRFAGDDEVKRLANTRRAWIAPKRDRTKMLTGFQHIKVPLIFTFRAREKTEQKKVNGRTVIEKVGFVPIAPAEILHAMDLVCLLPHRAGGVPQWRSEKETEDWCIKLPLYLDPFIPKADAIPLDEHLGEAFARWAKGGEVLEGPPRESGQQQVLSPPETKRQSFGARLDEAIERDGLAGLKRARQACEEAGATKNLEYIDTNWIELEAKAHAVETARSAPKPKLPGL